MDVGAGDFRADVISRTFLGEKTEYLLRCGKVELQCRPPQCRRRRRQRDSGGRRGRRARRRERLDGAAGNRSMKARLLLAVLCCWAAAGLAQRRAKRTAAMTHIPHQASRWHGGAARSRRSHDGDCHSHRRRSDHAYPWLAVVAIDPFSKQEQAMQRPVQAAGPFDLWIPRARNSPTIRAPSSACSTLPHTRKRMHRSLLIYYLGVPDTTPEFADAAKLDASLSERTARARTAAGGTPR